MPNMPMEIRALKQQLSAWAQPYVAEAASLGRYFLLRVQEDQCVKSAGMLAYVTLLAIVPLMAISFSVLTAFPAFEGVTDHLREVMVEYLVPAATEAVDEHLEGFLGRAAELTAVGVAALAVSALLLLNAVERVLNEIWRVDQPRPMLQQFMVYWTVLTLGPLLLGVSIVSTSYMGSVTLGPLEPPSAITGLLLSLAPFVVQAAVFALVYGLVPHRRVPVRHALVGGAAASALFELAKSGFAAFIAQAPSYEAIYGALAALPIFLIWLYISWLVILLGAELTQALRGHAWRVEGSLGGERWALLLAVRVLGRLQEAQRQGQGATFLQLLEQEPEAGEQGLVRVLDALRRSGVIDYNADGFWILVRDLSTLTLAELQRRNAFPLPPAAEVGDGEAIWEQRLAERLRQVEERWASAFAIPLGELLEPSREPGEASSTARTEAL